jgi:hypothetical protein
MAMTGELTGNDSLYWGTCHVLMYNRVLCSWAGYYIGKACDCGPYSRESGYYSTDKEAQNALLDYIPRLR